jgi:hypothetical protein
MYTSNTLENTNKTDRTLDALVSKFRGYLNIIKDKKKIGILLDVNNLKKSNIELKKQFDDDVRIETVKKIGMGIKSKIENEINNFYDEYSKVFKGWYSFLEVAENYYKPKLREDDISFENYIREMSKFFETINIGVVSDGRDATEEEKEQNRQNEKNERLRFSELIRLKLKDKPIEGIKILSNSSK